MTSTALLSLVLLAVDTAFEPDQSKLPVPPPKAATVLLDEAGNHSFLSMAGEKADWRVEDGLLVSTAKKNQNHIVSKLHFRDADIHVEFMLPEKGPGNSGVYIHGNYEVQIFNSVGKEKPTQEDAGAVYGFSPPSENACRPPGEWQVLDIRYRAPRRNEAGKIVENGTITVWFNGKKVQDGAEVGEPKSVFHPFRFGNTPYLDKIRDRQKQTMTGPVFLQDHGNPVKFRNVWVLPADENAFTYEPPAAESAPAAASNDKASRPNIVFILADDLGYGDLGCYGQKQIRTPQLDRMASEGLRFTNFYAGCTVCAPSRCVLMTGLHTGHCLIRGNARQPLRPEDVTTAEVLRAAGYRTGLFGKWGLGEIDSTGAPTKQGFDAFFGYVNQAHAHNYYPTFLWRNEERVPLKNVVPNEGAEGTGKASEKREYSHDLIMDEALRFVREQREQPFFLYLAVTLPHANNEAKQDGMEIPDLGDYARESWPPQQQAHAAMISRLDADVGRLLALLKELKLDDNTLVIFSSDNGPHAEGGADPKFFASSGPLRGIKRSLTEGGIRVPLIARQPGKIKPGVSDFVGGFQDVLPTFAELAGAKDLPPKLDGVSFAPTLLGRGEQKPHEDLYWAFYEQGAGRALRRGDWKIVQQPRHSPPRLYDLAKDLGEDRDLAKENPDIVKELVARMDAADEPNERWKFPPASGK